jgi:hypothetical protein
MGSRKALARFLRSEPSPAHAHAAFHTIPPATNPRPRNREMARGARRRGVRAAVRMWGMAAGRGAAGAWAMVAAGAGEGGRSGGAGRRHGRLGLVCGTWVVEAVCRHAMRLGRRCIRILLLTPE